MESKNETTKIETEAELQACAVEIHITDKAWKKLMGYCRATNLEVSGFTLIQREDHVIKVLDCFITKQTSTSTSTEMDADDMGKLFMELFKKKIIGQEGGPKLGHFHTHPTFAVFWSGTDMTMRETLRKGVDYYVSLVLNQKGDVLGAIDINGEFPMSINKVPIFFISEESEEEKLCKKEVEEKVNPPSYAGGRNYHYGHMGVSESGMFPGFVKEDWEKDYDERFGKEKSYRGEGKYLDKDRIFSDESGSWYYENGLKIWLEKKEEKA